MIDGTLRLGAKILCPNVWHFFESRQEKINTTTLVKNIAQRYSTYFTYSTLHDLKNERKFAL
jgi:hypothetical protein